LAEMMNYPAVISNEASVIAKIADARARGFLVDGHAPMLSGKALDKYISAGIHTDHECSSFEEACEKLSKGQWIMIRQGTAARNLDALLPLFSEPYNRRCLLVTDDRHPADIVNDGHIDNIIRQAIAKGASPSVAIRMATIQAAQCFGLSYVGAIAPAYRADILVLNDLNSVDIIDVYSSGKKVVENKRTVELDMPIVSDELTDAVYNSFHISELSPSDFYIAPNSNRCRVIKILSGELVTKSIELDIDWTNNNGVDIERDILKLAVIERHKGTGHKGIGFINGIGLKKGAIASSVSHDSHNIIVIGTNDDDMAIAANRIREVGGNIVVCDGEIIAEMPLPIGGLMSDLSGAEIANKNAIVRESVYKLGVPLDIEPFMNMAFVSLAVIPSLKMTTLGLVDVDNWKLVSLYV
ncbi:MAG: adenine deaminase, partial [Clostridia bacterium]|nr:adenine deaminase [Clostridia bacterium]